MARAQLAGQGMTLVFLDDDDLLRDPRWHVEEELKYKRGELKSYLDHSNFLESNSLTIETFPEFFIHNT